MTIKDFKLREQDSDMGLCSLVDFFIKFYLHTYSQETPYPLKII